MDEVRAELVRLAEETARRWVLRGRVRLARGRSRLDALNVYPVPDGDTGTNMHRTLESGLMQAAGAGTPREQALALSRGAVLGARGNSGVILSQLIRGAAEVFAQARLVEAGTIAQGFARADALAWAAVAQPVEGTILSVSAAAAAAAREAARESADPVAVVDAALAAADAALARTPEQLPALARAGVVDAGGAGYVLLLQALADTLHGESSAAETAETPAPSGIEYAGPGYEVMFRVTGPVPGAADALRAELTAVGDSVLVSEDAEGLTVHVHTDDVGAVTSAGLARGRLDDLRVTDLLAAAHRHAGPTDAGGDAAAGASTDRAGTEEPEPGDVHPAPRAGVVACAEGEGLAEVFRAAGAVTVASTPRARASTGDLLAAILGCAVPEVLVLPNDGDAHLAAEQAAREAQQEGVTVHVVPTTSPVQGIAALAVLDVTRPPAQSVKALAAAGAAVRTGAVSLADREAMTEAGPCRPGQAVGVAAGRIVSVADEPSSAAAAVLDHLLAEGGELVTLVVGDPSVPGLAEAVARVARERHGAEVSVLSGGQPVFPLLIGVE